MSLDSTGSRVDLTGERSVLTARTARQSRLGQLDPSEYAGPDPIEPFFRALVWARLGLLALTAAMALSRLDRATRPWLVVTACAAMLLATIGLTWWGHRQPDRRRTQAWVEVVVALVILALTVPALDPSVRTPPLTGFWIAAPGLAVVLACGWIESLGAALLLGAASLLVGGEITLDRVGLLIVLVTGAAGLGWTIDVVRATVLEREEARVSNAALAERQRLSRIVHDGVLQVLAMVEREASHLGPRGAVLARHAHEQEVQLRILIQQTHVDPQGESGTPTHVDVAAMLERHAAPNVSVATPGEPVMIHQMRASEIDAATTEALNNVARHAGPGAKAWVFLEQEDDQLILSIRDNGVGGDPNDFAVAMRSGRMGMRQSIYGRIRDLGGTATLRAAPGRGVEWEFRIPAQA